MSTPTHADTAQDMDSSVAEDSPPRRQAVSPEATVTAPLGGSLTQRRHVVLIVIAASLPLIVLVILGIVQGKILAEARVAEERVALARAGALTAGAFVEGNLATVRSLARLPSLRTPASPAALERTLNMLLAENPEWDGWGIAGPDGLNIASTGAAPGTLNISDRPYFQEVLQTGRAVVSPAVINRRTGRPTVVLAVPLDTPAYGRCVIIVSLSTARLAAEIQALRQDANVQVTLIDSEGKLFANPTQEATDALPSVRGRPAADAALNGDTGSLIGQTGDGTEMLFAYAPVPELGWAVIAAQPTAAAFDVVRRQTLLGGGILALAMLLAALISWQLGGRLAELYERQRAATARAEATANTLQQVTAQSERRRRFFEGVIASAPVAIAILRGREYRHEELNARYQALHPDTPVLGQDIAAVFPPETASAMREVFDLVYETGQQVVLTDQAWRLEAGSDAPAPRYFTHIVSRLDDESGEPDAILSVVHETTDAVLARQRAEREKDEMLSTASHELKTPLTSLGLAAQMIDRMFERGTVDEARLTRNIGTIRSQVARVSRLIGSLLDVSRIENGRHAMTWEPVDLAQLARAAVIRERDALPEDSNHEIRLQSEEPSIMVEGDEARLEQVVANLLSNAVKYSPAGGVVEVKVGSVDDQVLLEVLDHGIGVPESERDALFAPFSRTASAVDAGVEGTGLGLYICRRIVEAHGGRIDQRETPGGGSIFWVSLPVRQVATNSASDGEAPQASDAA